MSLSFEESLKKSMEAKTRLMAARSMSIEPEVAAAAMSVNDMEVMNNSIMTLDEDYGIAAYSGDDGNWIQHPDYDVYRYFSDDNISTVNDEKDIILNKKQFNITQEENSQYIPFEMNRYYDGFDLAGYNDPSNDKSSTVISIHYQTKNGRHAASKPVNVTYNNEKIRFGWLIDAGATVDVGTLEFEIQVHGTISSENRETKSYVWKTKRNKDLNVLESLCDCNDVINNIDDTWLQELVTDIVEKVTTQIAGVEVAGQVAAAETAASAAQSAAATAKSYAETAVSSATTVVNQTLANYPTKDEMNNSIGEAIRGADISDKLNDYYTKSETYNQDEVDKMISDIGDDISDVSDRLVNYAELSDVNALSEKFGTLVDGEGTELTVEEYVRQEVDAVDVSEELGDLGTNEDGTKKTVVQYVTDAIAAEDITTKLGNYYTKSETYSKDEVDGLLDNVEVDLSDYATKSFVTDKTDALSTSVDANTSGISTINSKIIEINNTLGSIDKTPNAQYITTYNQPFVFEGEEYSGENTLVLYEIYNKDKENETRSVVSSHEIKGGSGIAASNSRVERITSTPLIKLSNERVVIYYNFTNDDTGIGYATWKIGNRTIVNKETIHNGENYIDITDYIGVGSDQKVSLIVTDDSNTILPTVVWYVSVVNITLESKFNDARYYAAGTPVDFTFTPDGAVDKTIHILLDGKEIGTKKSIKSAAGLLDSYTIPAQEHGSHLVEAYVTATVNNTVVGEDRSIYVAKDIVWFDNESDIPVIGCATPVINTIQHNTINIKYTVFDPNTDNPEIVWHIDGVAMQPEIPEKDEKGYYTKSYKANEFGTFEFVITCGKAEPKTITLNVEELDIDVTPVTTGIAFDFNPSGYSNSNANKLWTDGTVSMSVSDNFDWVNGGYQYDENGDQYFCVKSGTTATFDYNLFADDAKTQGKEFKVVFKTTNIKNRDTTFISCMNSGIGLDMKVQDANIYSSNGSLYSPYCEEDIIEFEFNINTIDNIPLVMTYEDGVGCRPMIYASDASFWQTTPQPITIGSTECDVYIYRMKAYTRSLNDSEILSNFILDARNADEIADRYNRNKIRHISDNGVKKLSMTGELTPESLAEACPDLRIIIVDAPWFTNDKDNKVDDTTITMIYKNGRPEDNWTCTGAQHSGQGTSSNEYGYSGRNIDLIMNGDASLFKWSDETGREIESKTITLTETSVPTNYLNVKVNIASSENQNNAQMARRYNEYNPFVRSAKFNDSRVKDCMEFYNCVIFVRENNEDVSTHREFKDCNTHFYAIGNVGDSKKTDSTRVNDKNDPRECVVEIKDYNVPLAEFPTGNGKDICNPSDWKAGNTAYDLLYAEYQYKDGKFKTFGSKSYEFRYEMKGITEEQREININAWRDMYKFVVTSDDEKFYSKLKEYFVVDSALYYYLFTERYTMVDNRAKNSFWHYGKVYITEEEAATLGDSAGGFIVDNEQAAINDGYRWDLTFGYDFDTSLGIDNTGKLVLTYGKEDTDYYVDGDPSSTYIYRAAESTFFSRLRDLFNSELQAMFVDRESKNAWSATSLIAQWDNAQKQFPEELWRLDIQRKYLRTYLGTSIDNSIAGAKEAIFLPQMMNGRKKYQRRMFERNQELYMATKYFGTTATQDQIRVRFNNPESYVVKPDFTLHITPYSDMYIGVSFYNGHKDNFRAKAGNEYLVHYPEGLETADITLIYGASFIQAIGDLSKCYIGDNDFTKATRLQSLVIGSDTDGYSNSYMSEIKLANNKLLEYLDVRNVTGLSSTIDLSQCSNMLELRAEGSGAKGVIFANGGKIQKFYLPAITSLTAKNLNYIEDFNIESYINLQTLVVENTPAIDVYEIVDTTLDIQTSLPEDSARLNVLRLVGINWSLENAEVLDDVILLRGQNSDGGESGQSVLAGAVFVPTIKQKQLEDYNAAWPDLEIAYNTRINQFPVTFVNYDGTELETQYVDEGGYAVDPVNRQDNPIEVPTRESTISTDYTYAGWDTNFSNLQIFEPKTITATFTETARKYGIQYMSMGQPVKGYETPVIGNYGDNMAYEGEIPTYMLEEGAYKYYLFKGWDKSGFLLEGEEEKDFDENGVKVVNAIYDDFKYVSGAFDGKELKDLSPVQIYALSKLTEPIDKSFSDYSINIETGDDYSFIMGYDVDYDDVNSEELISAKRTFSGNEGDYYDTGITLFDEDRDFVLALDYEMLANATSATLMQCYQTSGTNGFKLSYESSPVLSWGGTSVGTGEDGKSVTVSPSAVGNREMLVIRHKQGDNNLYIYASNLSSDDIKTYILSRDVVTKSDTATLIFGAAKTDAGRIANYAKGEVNWCKIWYKDLGDDTCRKLVSWTHEEITVEVSGFNRYQLHDDTTKESMMSLLATHVLSVKKSYNLSSNSNTGGWADCELNSFLNNRFYNAIPYQIKALIKKVSVKSTIGDNLTATSSSGCYINVPALYDVYDSAANEYKPELYEFASTIDYLTGLTDSQETTNRVRKYADSGENDDGVQYWLRSPSIGTWSTSRYCYSIDKNGSPQQVTGTSSSLGVLIEISF